MLKIVFWAKLIVFETFVWILGKFLAHCSLFCQQRHFGCKVISIWWLLWPIMMAFCWLFRSLGFFLCWTFLFHWPLKESFGTLHPGFFHRFSKVFAFPIQRKLISPIFFGKFWTNFTNNSCKTTIGIPNQKTHKFHNWSAHMKCLWN